MIENVFSEGGSLWLLSSHCTTAAVFELQPVSLCRSETEDGGLATVPAAELKGKVCVEQYLGYR